MNSRLPLLLTTMLALCACSSNDTGQEQAATVQAPAPETAQSEIDLAKMNLCEEVPAELVAQTLGGSLLKPGQRSDYGTSQGCSYEIDPAGDDTYEYCNIWVMSPMLFGDPDAQLASDRALGQYSTTEWLKDLGDKAYVDHNKTESQTKIHILLKERMSIEVSAEHFEDARKLAELALSRLQEP